MSGAGRKSKYRKGVMSEFLNELPVPEEGEVIALVRGTRGANIIEIELPVAAATEPVGSVIAVDEEGGGCGGGMAESRDSKVEVEQGLALLPNKFKKVIWVKRNDFVILERAEASTELVASSTARVQYIIKQILNKEQIKHIKQVGKWPSGGFGDEQLSRGGGGGGGYGDDLLLGQEEGGAAFGVAGADEGEEEQNEEEQEEELVDACGNTIEKAKRPAGI